MEKLEQTIRETFKNYGIKEVNLTMKLIVFEKYAAVTMPMLDEFKKHVRIDKIKADQNGHMVIHFNSKHHSVNIY